jgi:hypothetical protein
MLSVRDPHNKMYYGDPHDESVIQLVIEIHISDGSSRPLVNRQTTTQRVVTLQFEKRCYKFIYT